MPNTPTIDKYNYLEDGLLVDGQHGGQRVDTALAGLVAHEGSELHQTLRVRLQRLLRKDRKIKKDDIRWELEKQAFATAIFSKHELLRRLGMLRNKQ